MNKSYFSWTFILCFRSDCRYLHPIITKIHTCQVYKKANSTIRFRPRLSFHCALRRQTCLELRGAHYLLLTQPTGRGLFDGGSRLYTEIFTSSSCSLRCGRGTKGGWFSGLFFCEVTWFFLLFFIKKEIFASFGKNWAGRLVSNLFNQTRPRSGYQGYHEEMVNQNKKSPLNHWPFVIHDSTVNCLVKVSFQRPAIQTSIISRGMIECWWSPRGY